MKARAIYPLLVFTACIMCSRAPVKDAMHPEQRLDLAEKLESQGKYSKAIEEYEKILSGFPPRQIAEKARFGLARSHMEAGEYEQAITSLEQFIDSYGTSDLVDNAIYMIAVCYMKQAPEPQRDQTKTLKAIEELNLLLKEYPSSDVAEEARKALNACKSKLAQKEYLNGMQYLKLKYYDSALIYFDLVLETYPETQWVAPSMLGKALSLIGLGRIDDARRVLEEIINSYPDTSQAREAAIRLDELGKGKKQGNLSSTKW